jgi:hypothetical protein
MCERDRGRGEDEVRSTSAVRYIQEEAISRTIVALKRTTRIELSMEVSEGEKIAVREAIGVGRGNDCREDVKRVKRHEREIEK